MFAKSILLLEDEPVIALDLRMELEEQGFQVHVAEDVPTALQLFEKHRPSFALLNFVLKTMDGMALARLLQSRSPVKILFITGARPKDLMASAQFNPAHGVLYKPFSIHQLRSFLLP